MNPTKFKQISKSKNKELKEVNELLEHEYHEGEIFINILDRNTREYIAMREKLVRKFNNILWYLHFI